MTTPIATQRRELDKLLDFYDAQKDFVAEQIKGYVRVIPTFFTETALAKFAAKGDRGGVLLPRVRTNSAETSHEAERVTA